MDKNMTDHFSSRIGDIASTYGTDTIFILGKGPSADAVSPDAMAGSLVIGVNDAERIAPTDITLFHADWVQPSWSQKLEKMGKVGSHIFYFTASM